MTTSTKSRLKGKRITVVLPASLAQEMREAVSKGLSVSQSELARQALRRELKRLGYANSEQA